jgi:cytochrome-b5 reductase
MSQVEMKGPMVKLKYEANMKRHIGMVAGGTGITPMLQIIEEVLRNPGDKTQLTLVYGSVTQEDILLKPRLDALASKHAAQFKVIYLVDKPARGWKGPVGFVTPELLKEHMPPPGDDSLVLVCGPPGMMVAVSGSKAKDFSQGEVGGALKGLGYAEKHVFKM